MYYVKVMTTGGVFQCVTGSCWLVRSIPQGSYR